MTLIRWDGGETEGRSFGRGETGVVLAHGAGAGQGHPRMVGLASALADRGLRVLTFDYPYVRAGRRSPDPQRVLLACHRAAAASLRAEVGDRLILAGRSMGGRMASYLAAEGEPCMGLVLFAYPLHPPGRTDRLRVDHLPGIEVPILAIQGTQDSFGRMELFDQYLAPLATVELMEGARHDLRLPGKTAVESDSWMGDRTAEWVQSVVESRQA